MHIMSDWISEEASPWSTDKSVLRAWARSQRGSQAADDVMVERHLRKLSRSLAARRSGGQIVQKVNKRGQLVSDVYIRVKRFDRVNKATGEIRRAKKYQVGFYVGGSGYLLVNDGRVSGRDIQRILDRQSRWQVAA